MIAGVKALPLSVMVQKLREARCAEVAFLSPGHVKDVTEKQEALLPTSRSQGETENYELNTDWERAL